LTDLRGYGESSKPKGDPNHLNYSKMEMGKDQFEVMKQLGYDEFIIVAHDRGARVAHRMALDYPKHIKKIVLIDMLPTLEVFENINSDIAMTYYHWFFMAQPDMLPEKILTENAEYLIKEKLKRWSSIGLNAFPKEVLSTYLDLACTPEAIHASCEDYRAAATIDLEHDRQSRDQKISCPLLALWAKNGLMDREFNVLKTWEKYASNVTGTPIESGHFIPEEATDKVNPLLLKWLKRELA
jgi:haloacetate dehalogenase